MNHSLSAYVCALLQKFLSETNMHNISNNPHPSIANCTDTKSSIDVYYFDSTYIHTVVGKV